MNQSVQARMNDLARICQQYRVSRLELFGSAAGDEFDPQRSDMDFLVDFLPLQEGQHFDCYFGLLEALSDLFQRPVDLVMSGSIRNPYFLQSVNKNRTPLYAA